MEGIIEKYMEEIEDLKSTLESSKNDLAYYKEKKRLARPNARGRIAGDNWSAQLEIAKYDLCIATIENKIELCKNQIKLRNTAIKEEKAKSKRTRK